MATNNSWDYSLDPTTGKIALGPYAGLTHEAARTAYAADQKAKRQQKFNSIVTNSQYNGMKDILGYVAAPLSMGSAVAAEGINGLTGQGGGAQWNRIGNAQTQRDLSDTFLGSGNYDKDGYRRANGFWGKAWNGGMAMLDPGELLLGGAALGGKADDVARLANRAIPEARRMIRSGVNPAHMEGVTRNGIFGNLFGNRAAREVVEDLPVRPPNLNGESDELYNLRYNTDVGPIPYQHERYVGDNTNVYLDGFTEIPEELGNSIGRVDSPIEVALDGRPVNAIGQGYQQSLDYITDPRYLESLARNNMKYQGMSREAALASAQRTVDDAVEKYNQTRIFTTTKGKPLMSNAEVQNAVHRGLNSTTPAGEYDVTSHLLSNQFHGTDFFNGGMGSAYGLRDDIPIIHAQHNPNALGESASVVHHELAHAADLDLAQAANLDERSIPHLFDGMHPKLQSVYGDRSVYPNRAEQTKREVAAYITEIKQNLGYAPGMETPVGSPENEAVFRKLLLDHDNMSPESVAAWKSAIERVFTVAGVGVGLNKYQQQK